MADMIKFFKGLEASLPASGVNGALYITTDEGAIYLGTGTGMKRLGDFVQVANVASLPEKAHESCLYYCVAENILAKWNGTEWTQINKQPTAEEMKTLLGLGSLAYLSEVVEENLSSALKEKVNAAAEGNHSHANKALLDTYAQTEADLADAVAKKHSHTFVESELNKIADGDVAKWNAAEGNAKSYTDEKIGALDFTDTAVDGEYVSAVNEVDGKISVIRKALPDYSETYDTKGAAATALDNAKAYADGLAANYDEKGAAASVKTELEAEIAKKVDKVEGKSLVSDVEITKLAGVKEGANKVEASENNGSIKIDGVETVVYTHPEKHSISDVTGLQDALDGKQAAGNYSVEGHKHVKADITDFAHTHIASEITDLDSTIKGYDYATKTELGDVDAKFANYKTAEAQKTIDDEQDRRLGVIEGDYLKAADIADFETKENVKKVADDLAAYAESNDEALAGVKAVAEAARTEEEVNSQIDTKITALNLGTTYEPIGAEDRAKAYVDGKFTDANLAQYTTEQEVKNIVDEVVAGAVDGDAVTGLANLVEYFHTHGGEAGEMGAAIDVLEGKVETIEGKPAYNITATQISNWDGEVGAKALAETKTTTAEVKTQIEAYGYATTGYADGKADAAKDAAIADAATKYETIGTAQGIVDGLKLAETYEPIGAESRAIAAAKTETETQVKALADGQVATNKNDIASIVEMLTWGSF